MLRGRFRMVYELAQRRQHDVSVRLLWDAGRDQTILSYRDREAGDAFVADVPNANALAAFYHPNVYRPRALAA